MNISYKNRKPPLLNIKDAIKAQSFYPKYFPDLTFGDPDNAILNAPNSLKGNFLMDSQYHFYLEGQVAICRPIDDGFEIDSSTQWLESVQKGVAQVLGIKESSVYVKTKQLGGNM